MRPRFGLRIPPCRSLPEVAACVRDAEEAGFDVAWLPDSQFLWRDVWGAMALSATQTSSIRLGTCVTNLETRHPSVTAAAAASVEELAGGRVILGIGSGDSAVKTLGLRPTNLARMREQIGIMRTLLAGDPADFDGRSLAVKSAGRRVPIYLAATGPKMQALAGELADGVIVVTGLQPELVRATLARIGEGAARANRRVEDLDVCFGTYAHVASERREAARIVKPYVVATAQTGGQALLHDLGIRIDPPEVVGGIYPDMSHAEDWDAACEAAATWVTDDQALTFADAFCLIGSPEEIADRLRAAADAGARSFYIRHFSSYTLPSELLRTFADTVLPRFAGGVGSTEPPRSGGVGFAGAGAGKDELLWPLFARFVEAETSVRPGETRVEARDERLRAFMTGVAAPALEELGASVSLDEANNLLARFGPETGEELLFVAYPATHHGNEMEEPLRPRARDGVWVGLGASQGKGGLAAVCAAVARLREEGVDPAGRVAVAVSSEGSSSHASSEVLYRSFGRLPAGGVLVVGTGNRISLGNRGRVDVVVRVPGRATHSSAAGPGDNPIPIVADVLRLLGGVPAGNRSHPQLGSASLVPYRLQCGPVAPHTIPAWCELVLDRRLVPGEEPDLAVAEIEKELSGLPVTVERSATMLPALVEPNAAVVRALQAGARATIGRELETLYRRDTFDAGYPCSLGVPTVMCGPSTSDFGGHGVLGEDAVDPAALREAAAIFAAAVASRVPAG